jgi:hypothetical protein
MLMNRPQGKLVLPAIALLVLLAAGGTAWWAMSTPDVPPPASAQAEAPPPAPAPAAHAEANARPAPAAPAEPSPVPKPEEIPQDEGTHGEFTSSLDLVKEKLLKQDVDLAKFDYFHKRVLKDSVLRGDYHKLLSDRAMLNRTKEQLLHPPGGTDGTEANVRRLMQIDQLREALSWKENPERDQVLAMVEEIILADAFHSGLQPDAKRSLAATKLELYEIFSENSPERALKLVEMAKGGRLEKMLAYFAEHNQRRLAKEHEISLQGMKGKK